jgi:hypothetical protein
MSPFYPCLNFGVHSKSPSVSFVSDRGRHISRDDNASEAAIEERAGAIARGEQPVTAPVTVPPEPDEAAVEERTGLVADRVPIVYLDAWARLNCQKPPRASDAEWHCALDDGGRFLDAWGAAAAAMHWGADELFDVPQEGRPGGLVWRLKGERVRTLGEDHARLANDARSTANHVRPKPFPYCVAI